MGADSPSSGSSVSESRYPSACCQLFPFLLTHMDLAVAGTSSVWLRCKFFRAVLYQWEIRPYTRWPAGACRAPCALSLSSCRSPLGLWFLPTGREAPPPHPGRQERMLSPQEWESH